MSDACPVPDAEGFEGYRLTRRAPMVDPLRTLLELRWASAIPRADYQNGTPELVRLLTEGRHDARIAAARSRFELGVKYALTGLRETEN